MYGQLQFKEDEFMLIRGTNRAVGTTVEEEINLALGL